ncbi:MAG: DM13 domain-containing protein [bacterium]|nr:DM13 domain-containing protein [bacterium]
MTTARRTIFAIVAVGGVVVAYWLVSPLFITRRVAEELPPTAPLDTASPMPAAAVPAAPSATATPPPPAAPPLSPVSGSVELAKGTFEGLAGHRAQGTARVVEISGKRYVRFESDFRVTNGPDLFVYLGREGRYDPNVRLAALKGNEGSQNYELPAGADLAAYDEVWVWCRAFSVPFGKATLMPTVLAE